jgi:TetR/AcrR family transcriptional regulator, regulator of biofilm formation and stress response
MSDSNLVARKNRRRRVARGQGREALCRALLRVVARDGFDAVTFRSVAAEANVTHGLASYHFRTREAMIHEALSWAVNHTIESSRLAASSNGIEGFVSDVPHMLSESPEEAVFQFELLLRALRSPALLDDVRKSYDEYVNAVAQSLGRFGIEGDAIARVVFAALDGLTLQQLLYGDQHRTEEAIEALRRLISLQANAAKGLSAPSSNGECP